jgi:hypothetical protein
MMTGDLELFANFTRPLIGMEVSHAWMGYGSAIFTDFGELHPREKYVKVLEGTHVVSASLVGRLGEIALDFSNGLGFQSFMSEQGNPDWSLSNRNGVHLTVVAGKLVLDRRNEQLS